MERDKDKENETERERQIQRETETKTRQRDRDSQTARKGKEEGKQTMCSHLGVTRAPTPWLSRVVKAVNQEFKVPTSCLSLMEYSTLVSLILSK